MGLGIRAPRFAWIAVLCGCTTSYRAEFVQPTAVANVNKTDQFLKCHMRNGDVYVLEKWQIDSKQARVLGVGLRYNAQREAVSAGNQSVALADIELFETNDPRSVTRSGIAVMAVVTGASLAVTALCLANPKACFGSCPTFYADDGSGQSLQAEGFSSSIARAFESTDVDAMWTALPQNGTLDLLMTNEALETHLVDSVRVLTVPRPPGGRVLRAGDRFFPATHIEPPQACRSDAGDCLSAVAAVDARSYLSLTDGKDLAAKETVELEFPAAHGPAGIVIAARNSLLNTFLFYQALAYMGRSAADWYMRFDHAPKSQLAALGGIGRLLGDIEVSIRQPDGTYAVAGSFSEVGPIAREVQLIPLPEALASPPARRASTKGDDPLVVRLTMTRGNWKVDHVGLAELGAPLQPTYIEPSSVSENGKPAPEALAKLLATGVHLATYPGDAYTLHFLLPPGDQELFLESRGYYYEWIRDSWLPEQDQFRLLRMFLDPAGAMQRLAPEYKRIEGDMERVFWNSRVGHR